MLLAPLDASDAGTPAAFGVRVVTGALDRVDEETQALQGDLVAEGEALLEAVTPDDYRRFLGRAFGFIEPLELSLLDTVGLDEYVPTKRLRKHILLRQDLEALGLRSVEIEALPRCMWIPLFENIHGALGWMFVMERQTLTHPALFRHLATVMPREAAFASSYLKCYAASLGEMWQSFADGIETSIKQPRDLDVIIAGAKAALRQFRRWRNTLDGKALSGPQQPLDEEAPTSRAITGPRSDRSQDLPPSSEEP